MKSVSVFYDSQQGKYFKVDKQTGETRKTHKNGSQYVRFKPDYSGSDYHLRKYYEHDLSPPSLRPRFTYKKQKSQKKDSLQNSSRKKQNKPLQRQTKSLVTFNAANILPSLRGAQSRMLQSRLGPTSAFDEKLRQYNRLKQQLRKQNHSPRDGFQGSRFIQKIPSEYKNQPFLIPEIAPHRKQLFFAPDSPHFIPLKAQIQKQREIYKKFHSGRATHNDREEKELIERKKNMKILENLFINKNNRDTCEVYNRV